MRCTKNSSFTLVLHNLQQAKLSRVASLLTVVQEQRITIEQQAARIQELSRDLALARSFSSPASPNPDSAHTLPSLQPNFMCETTGGAESGQRRGKAGQGNELRTSLRVCSGCTRKLDKSSFSKNQWRNSSSSRCSSCVDSLVGVSACDTATPVPTPTTRSTAAPPIALATTGMPGVSACTLAPTV